MEKVITATKALIRLALEEDVGQGDLTALAVPEAMQATAKLIAKEDVILSGSEIAKMVLEVFGAKASLEIHKKDGDKILKSETILTMVGNARDLLTCERTILNFLQRFSGIASMSAQYRAALEGKKLTILDTRKTAPGMRYWDKKAVKDGGLSNHRARLDDGVLIKENHIRAAGSITNALKNLAGKVPSQISIEVEVTNLQEAMEAMDAGANRLLLDNFSPSGLKEIIPKLKARKSSIYLEGSGGITLQNLKEYASTGVDAVSIGALTHSVRAADLSLLFEFH